MLKLFFTFFKIGLLTFGGGYAMIPMISEEVANWGISAYTLSDFIAISESTPGPFAINIATFIGYSSYGILGAIIATIGVILPSFIVMLCIAIFINKVRQTKFFKIFIQITTPIVLGLILSSSIKIASLNLFNISSYKLFIQEFSLNLVTIISLIILIFALVIYYIIKKKRISPFKLISLSLMCGVIAYFINLI